MQLMSLPISVTILTKNCYPLLTRLLPVLKDFSEVLLLDSGSTDDIEQLTLQFPNVRLEKSPWIGFGKMHQKAVALARHEWIFSLDSDEIPDQTLIEQLATTVLVPHHVYRIERHNYYRTQRIKGCGWKAEKIVRIFHRKHANFSDDAVHEKVIHPDLEICTLQGAIAHYSYRSVSDFIQKMQLYSDLFVTQHPDKKVHSAWSGVIRALFAFFKNYFLRKGFLDGYAGFLICFSQSCTTMYKYFKLYEKS